MIRKRIVLCCALIAAALSIPYIVPAMENMKMPPGMTPQLMQMMMKPGPAHPPGIPADAKPYFGCIPSMGFHYVSDKNKPFGPIYGWYNGKPTFTEIMPSDKEFLQHKDWNKQLVPLPGYHIDHVDFWYEPHGHPGYPVAHWDVHAWYVSHDEHMHYCDNKSGKRPSFV
jgi:hypothetical protein